MDASLIFCLICLSFGLIQAALMLLHAWEHLRFHRRRSDSPLTVNPNLRVTLIAPCKGLDPDLHENLLALFRQQHPNFELCFVVENEADPALPVIRDVAAENPHVGSRVVIAGLAHDSGQKVHNLICASQAVLNSPHRPHILAFVDSDACPHPEWLSRLVSRIGCGKFAVATGYRWYAPQGKHWANRLLSAVNNTVIAVMGPHGFNLVWGGAWAIRTETFEELGLPAAWQGTLSDDLVVSRLVHAAPLKVGYEPHCLVQSAADFDLPRVFEFVRRQFLVTRIYAPLWWHFAFWSGLLTNGCLLGLGAVAAWGLVAGSPQTTLTAVAGGVLIWALGALRFHMAAIAVRPYVAVEDAEYDTVARFNFWGWPIVSLTTWVGTLASACGNTIVWRGIRYRLDSADQTTILNHPADEPVAILKFERTSHAQPKARAA
ncbi:MAG: glycosyltransferase [Planctomycetes bacterium]|nr:glycosyltransferase [Planctomycetota bacterium]